MHGRQFNATAVPTLASLANRPGVGLRLRPDVLFIGSTMTEKYKNNSGSTLASGINDSQTTLSVSSASSFPTGGNFRIRIGTEIMLVTGVSGTTFTVTRGAESTIAASHSGGDSVLGVLTAGAIDQLRIDDCGADTVGNRPAAGVAGRLYLPTSGLAIERDNGSLWTPYGPLHKFTRGFQVSDFTWDNQGSAAATDQGGAIYLTCPNNNGESIHALYKAVSTPHTITACFSAPLFSSISAANATPGFGLLHRVSGGGLRLFGIRWRQSSSVHPVYRIDSWTSSTSSSSLGTPTVIGPTQNVFWLRLVDDNTNRKFLISVDGVNFVQILSETRSTFITATQGGFFLDPNINGSTFDSQVMLLSWEVT